MFGAHPMFRIGGAAGYQIPYSLRFRRSNNAAMTRTAGTPTNAKIATWSFWHKRGALGPEWVWGESTGGASTFFSFDNGAPDTIRILVRGASLTSTPVFRDPSAWHHFVVAVDTTQATAADRIKVYANNQAVTMSGTITLNADITFNESGKSIKISNGAGWFATSADYIDGYLAEFNFIDGQALTPSSFGYTAGSVWVPKQYAGTYGNNGFYLKFNDATTTTTIGYDSSGNANNWTTSGISVTSGVTFDQMLDTPTTNFSTMNPIASHTSVGTFAVANMQWSYGAGAYYPIIVGSAAINSKSYWEVTVTSVGGAAYIGIILASQQVKGTEGTNNTLSSAGCWSYDNLGKKNNNNAPGSGTAYGSTYTTGDVIGVTYDPSTTTLTFYKNNVSQGSAYTNVTSGDVYAFVSGISGADFAVNFGQRPFSYTPPTGFKALSTANITSTAVSTSGTFTGNAAADGPFVWTNGNPATLTINGNGVTFGTDADKTAGGFKLRTSSASYNASGSNTWTATAGKRLVQSRKPNNAQANP